MAKLDDLLRALLKNGLKISPKNCSCLEQNNNTWVIKFSLKTGEFVLSLWEID